VILTAGSKVIYPSQGPCLIGAVVQRVVEDRLVLFHELRVLSGGGTLFVPPDSVRAIGIRPLLKKSKIPKLLDRLKEPTRSPDNWKERANNNIKRFASGSAFALAEVVASLTALSGTRTLTSTDYKALEKAKRLLVCEISEVTGETLSAVEGEVEEALRAGEEKGSRVASASPRLSSRGMNPAPASPAIRRRRREVADKPRAAQAETMLALRASLALTLFPKRS
jgi:CarD family transcriptional regulator